jgi:hypothetical protein
MYFIMEQSENLENLVSTVNATANHSLSRLASYISRYIVLLDNLHHLDC